MQVGIKYFWILFFSFVLVACGGSGSGGDATVTPSLPSDATTITESNATEVAGTSVDMSVTYSLPPAKGSNSQTISSITNQVIRDVMSKMGISHRYAQRTTDTYDCFDGNGTTVESYEESASSASGSITYNSCDMGGGVYIDGSVSADISFNDTTGDFSIHMNGTLTLSGNLPDITLALNVNYSGNDSSDDFSFTSAISVSGSADGNFLATTTEPITGNWFDIYSGEILVEGGEGTRLRIEVVDTNQADVYLDDGSGSFNYYDTVAL